MTKANANLLAEIKALREQVAARDRRNVELEAALSRANDRETAMSEILRVIATSPTDIQPVLDAMAESAARLCESFDVAIFRREGDRLRLVANHGPIPVGPTGEFTLPLVRGTVSGRAVLDGRTVQVADMQAEADEFPEGSQDARRMGHRTILSVPLTREGVAIGTINLRRTEAQLFTERQVALLETFADQAVIAIENVRLFTELQHKNEALTQAHAQVSEALEQQTATGEILRVISSSPTDVQPVFDTIVESVVRLCDGVSGTVYRFDGDLIHLIAQHHSLTSDQLEAFRQVYPIPPSRTSVVAQSILDRIVIHVRDFEGDPGIPSASREMARAVGHRSLLAVPMLREESPVGAISVGRRGRHGEARPFSDREIEMVKTFADQAVIAIENVRLFKELEAKNSELTTTLDHQTATSEILKVISGSPTEVQPVFDTIARNASRLCDGMWTVVVRYDGELIHLVANENSRVDPATHQLRFPAPLTRRSLAARPILEGTIVHITDVTRDLDVDQETMAALGLRACLGVPMVLDGRPIGSINVSKDVAVPFTDRQIELLKTFANQAVIAIENVRLFTELQARNREVTEALEQQTATAEVLRVISRSPTDVQPVFEAIVESAARLCNASNSTVYRYDGQLVHLEALYALTSVVETTLRGRWPRPLGGESVVDLALRDARVIHFPDVESDPSVPPLSRRLATMIGFRSVLTVPMLRENRPVGCITVTRPEPSAFSDTQISLLKTFADQAVIAIENVRLFTELQEKNLALTEAHAQVTETLERQTATSEILRVISSAHTDAQPVFDTIVKSAARLCNAANAAVFRVEGGMLHHPANYGSAPEALAAIRARYPRPVGMDTVPGLAIRARSPVQIPDVEDPSVTAHAREAGHVLGFRGCVGVPMLSAGEAVGAIVVTRRTPGLFSDAEVGLLQTFADQAVIAVENVRLFTELQASNRELTTALDTQTATSDILRVISRSQTDVQPVFDAILASAVRLLGGYSGLLSRTAGDQIELAALTSTDDAGDAAARAAYPHSLQSGEPHAQVIRDRVPLNIADAHTDLRLPEATRVYARARGYRSWVLVPLLRHDEAVGAIGVTRRDPGGFTDDEIALLRTFADQAVIAIENARLLTELQARTQELTRSVGELRALGEVGQAISSTLDLQTVLSTIVARATQLASMDSGVIYEYDEANEQFYLRATQDLEEDIVEMLRAVPVRKGEGVTGRAALTREPVQIPDITQGGAYQSRVRDALLGGGLSGLARRSAASRGPHHRGVDRTPSDPGRVLGGGHRSSPDLRDAISAGHPERSPLSRAGGQESTARGRQPA